MNQMLKFYRAIFLLSILLGLPLISLTSEESLSQANPLWREGGAGDAAPELERLSRAFERLAEKVQPGVVQIRANRKASTDAESGSQRPSNSRGSGFLINLNPFQLNGDSI